MKAFPLWRIFLGVAWLANYVLHLLAEDYDDDDWNTATISNASLTTTPNSTDNSTTWVKEDRERYDKDDGMSSNTIRNIAVGVSSLVIGCAAAVCKQRRKKTRATENSPETPVTAPVPTPGVGNAGATSPNQGTWDLTSGSSKNGFSSGSNQPLSTITSSDSGIYSNNNFLSNYSSASDYSSYSTYAKI